MMVSTKHVSTLLGVTALMLVSGCSSSSSDGSLQGESPTATGGGTAQSCSREQLEANRELGKAFNTASGFDEMFEKMDPSYIQHNPIMRRFGEVNNVTGREEFKLLNDLISRGDQSVGPPKPLPGQPEGDPVHLIIADCDHVFVMRKSYAPDPQRKGEFYPVFDFDAWRIKDGKLAEHWDGLRLPDEAPEILRVPVRDLPPVSRGAGK